MKQILIVNSGKALNAGTSVTVNDLSGLAEGAATFFELGGNALLAAAATKNFGIAVGRPNNQRPFIIPEVDINSLTITKSLPRKGNAFSATFTMPTTVVGEEYTLRFFKKGTVPHERNSWTVSMVATVTTAATSAAAMRNAINERASEEFNVTATGSSATVTITANDKTDWEVVAYDKLAGTTITITPFMPTSGDKAHIEFLASQCAAGKGWYHTYGEGKEYIPGYPETVEDLVPNTSGSSGASTAGYAVYNLRFKVGRDFTKTRDEQVWQMVHIAVPVNNPSYATFDKILPEGNFMANKIAASTTTGG